MTQTIFGLPRKLGAALALSVLTLAALTATAPEHAHAAYRCLKVLGKNGNYVVCPQGDGTVKVTKVPSRIPGR